MGMKFERDLAQIMSERQLFRPVAQAHPVSLQSAKHGWLYAPMSSAAFETLQIFTLLRDAAAK